MSKRRTRDDVLKGMWGKIDPETLKKIFLRGFEGTIDPKTLEKLFAISTPGLTNRFGPDHPETYFIRGPNGRRIALQRSGDPEGEVVFLFHGAPGSRIGPIPRPAVLQRHGINLITYDRPDYGYSDPNLGRRPIDTIEDMESILRYLEKSGIMRRGQKFSIIGRSQGGPHALACATTDKLEGLERVAILGSPAPLYLLGEKQLEGLGLTNTRDLRQTHEQMAEALTTRVAAMQQEGPEVLYDLISPDFAPADRKAVDDFKEILLASYEAAIEFGPGGWIADAVATRTDWGFDLSAINKEILIVYGDKDPFSSKVSARYLADNIGVTERDGQRIRRVDVQEVMVSEGSHFDVGFKLLLSAADWAKAGRLPSFEGAVITGHRAGVLAATTTGGAGKKTPAVEKLDRQLEEIRASLGHTLSTPADENPMTERERETRRIQEMGVHAIDYAEQFDKPTAPRATPSSSPSTMRKGNLPPR